MFDLLVSIQCWCSCVALSNWVSVVFFARLSPSLGRELQPLWWSDIYFMSDDLPDPHSTQNKGLFVQSRCQGKGSSWIDQKLEGLKEGWGSGNEDSWWEAPKVGEGEDKGKTFLTKNVHEGLWQEQPQGV